MPKMQALAGMANCGVWKRCKQHQVRPRIQLLKHSNIQTTQGGGGIEEVARSPQDL